MGIQIFIFAVGPTPPTLRQLLVLALRAGGLIVARCNAKLRPRNIYSTEARCKVPAGGGGLYDAACHDRVSAASYMLNIYIGSGLAVGPKTPICYLVGGRD
jgi:hypothetical protein